MRVKTHLSKVDFIENDLIRVGYSIEASNKSKDRDDNDGELVVPF